MKILSVVFLTAIYCFAIGVVTQSLAHANFKDKSASSQEKIISEISSKLFYHTSQTESSLNSFNIFSFKNFKNPFIVFSPLVINTEELFCSEFSQYFSFSRNILIKYRKSDMIFPFHYFW